MPSKLSNNIPPTDFTKNCQGYYLFTANQIDLNILMRTGLFAVLFSTKFSLRTKHTAPPGGLPATAQPQNVFQQSAGHVFFFMGIPWSHCVGSTQKYKNRRFLSTLSPPFAISIILQRPFPKCIPAKKGGTEPVAPPPAASVTDLLDVLSGAKGQRNTPDTRQSHHCVDDSAEDRVLPTEDPSHKVKLKKPYTSPVQSADDGEYQSNSVHQHEKNPILSCFLFVLFCLSLPRRNAGKHSTAMDRLLIVLTKC